MDSDKKVDMAIVADALLDAGQKAAKGRELGIPGILDSFVLACAAFIAAGCRNPETKLAEYERFVRNLAVNLDIAENAIKDKKS